MLKTIPSFTSLVQYSFLETICHWDNDGIKVMIKVPIKSQNPKETSHHHDSSQCRLRYYGNDLQII